MDEIALIKIFELNAVSDLEYFKMVSTALDLEFYHEESPVLFTFCNDTFVLDVSGSLNCTLIFVDDNLNSKTSYLNEYLNYFVKKKEIFYFILKFLAYFDKQKKPMASFNLKSHYFCDCVFTGNYCDNIKIKENFNIFTHKYYDVEYEEEFRALGLLPYIFQEELSENLSNFYGLEDFNKKISNIFKGSNYMIDNIIVERNEVFIDGKKSPLASLGFIRGLSLKDSISLTQLEDGFDSIN